MYSTESYSSSLDTRAADLCEPSFQFQHAVAAVRAGAAVSDVAQRFLRQLSRSERLHLLDGDEKFYPGLRKILLDRYNRHPFIHGSLPRLSLPGIRFTDGPRGIVMGESTAFPVAMARGATWDVDLERRVGDAIGLEGKAQGANYFAGICINLPRHPAWGRIQETYGEDPILLGRFGSALAEGAQRHVMACVKHFALNSMENARFRINVEVDEDVLHEVYLPHFRQVIETGVASVMSSYNSVRGEFAGQNHELLTQILRDQWKFDGFTISDFIFGLRDPTLSVTAGLDIEAPFAQQRAGHLSKALDTGKISWAHIDEVAMRIIRTQLRFASVLSAEKPGASVVFSAEHRALAREVASRAMVLLKNEPLDGQTAPLLPLAKNGLSKVAVIGRLANAANTGDKGSSQVFSPHVVTPYAGITSALSGSNSQVFLEDSDCIDKMRQAASRADVAICVVGYDASDEGEFVVPSLQSDPDLADLLLMPASDEESNTLSIVKGAGQNASDNAGIEVGAGGDRRSLRLRPKDVEMIRACVAANPRTVVVVICGGAVIMEDWRDEVSSLLISWYAGAEGGHALADVLFGETDASGRLPFSIPRAESHLPFFDMEASSIKYDRWFGQSLLDKLGVDAAFPLGYGLSYTTFSFEDLKITSTSHDKESFSLSVTIRNKGERHGRHVAQVYGYPRMPDFPSRVLLGFEPVALDAGEAKEVRIIASLRPVQRWVNGKFELPLSELMVEVASHAGDLEAKRAMWIA